MFEDEKVIIIEKNRVQSIKLYKGVSDYYKLTLKSIYEPIKKTQKMRIAIQRLLKEPQTMIDMIDNEEILLEIREAIDNKIIRMRYANAKTDN